MTDENKVQPIDPSKLIGRDINHVQERLEYHEFRYRIINENGFMTSEIDLNRYTLIQNHESVIINAYFG